MPPAALRNVAIAPQHVPGVVLIGEGVESQGQVAEAFLNEPRGAPPVVAVSEALRLGTRGRWTSMIAESLSSPTILGPKLRSKCEGPMERSNACCGSWIGEMPVSMQEAAANSISHLFFGRS